MLLTKLRILLALGFLLSLAVMPARALTIGYCDGSGTGCTQPSTAWSVATTGVQTITFDNLAGDFDTSGTGITDTAHPGPTFFGVRSGSDYETVTSTSPNPNWGTGAYLEVPVNSSHPGYAEVTLAPGTTAAAVDLMMGDSSNGFAPMAAAITICVSITTVGACDSTYSVTTEQPATSANEVFFGVTASSNIRSITFSGPAGGTDSVMMDNFEYGEDDSTPEPVSALLMGSGLLLLAGRRLVLKRA